MGKWISKKSGVEGFFEMEEGNTVTGKLLTYNDDPGGDAGPFFVFELTENCKTVKIKNEQGQPGYDDKQGDYRLETVKKGSLVGVSCVTALEGLEDGNIGKEITVTCTGERPSRKKGHNPQKLLDVTISDD